MPEGGELRVEASVKDPRKVLVTVADTGEGIPEENLDRIFDPFFTTKKGGTGLGLSICYNIVKSHGGDIEVTSRPGQGTTMLIHLPLEGGESAMKFKILVVDDEKNIRDIFSLLLAEKGYAVESGRRAAARAGARPGAFGPGRRPPGHEPARHVRPRRPGRGARGACPRCRVDHRHRLRDDPQRRRGDKLGAYAYLEKPVDNEELLLLIARALRGAAARGRGRGPEGRADARYASRTSSARAARMNSSSR